jgi:L-iditol 2-dehydrogenase
MKALIYNPTPVRWMACKAAGWLWPAAYWSRLSGLRYAEVAVPDLPTGEWVRLRTVLGGICGTDLALIFQRSHPATVLRALTSFPVILGHENVAVVDAVGPAVTGWQVGQRVCVEPAVSCAARGIAPPCGPCSAGLFALCENQAGGGLPKGTMVGMNNFTGGSWAPYFVAHHSQLHAVPEGLSDEAAVLVDPLACALHAVLRRRPMDTERVLVVGSGIIGLGIVASLRAVGCRCPVAALVRHGHQGEAMRAAGADQIVLCPPGTSGAQRYEQVAAAIGGRRIPSLFGHQSLMGGFEVAYDCVGTGRSLTDCMNFVHARGTVVEVGTTQIGIIDATSLWMSELTVLGAYGRQFEPTDGQARHTYELVFDLLRSGKLQVEGWLSRTYRPADYRRALADLTVPGKSRIIKAAFTPGA